MAVSPHSIFVEGLVIGYGNVKVIEGLDMKVTAGSIYGLLGPSGCGKSTLLKVLLGQLYPENGVVNVLSRPPGSHGHNVPGRAVGYAPQEAALYTDITIEETFEFHSKLQGMKKEKLESRKKWLTDFLDLPPMNRIVGQLSGGQNRRLSLAVALLHDPQLLILDEPTVGVDPLLRSRIWQHLSEVARSGVTVIITTHYIEEARQAHCVGLMRNGRLLDEGAPMDLINKYNLTTLEEVFLALCRSNDQDVTTSPSVYKRKGGNPEKIPLLSSAPTKEQNDDSFTRLTKNQANQSTDSLSLRSLSPINTPDHTPNEYKHHQHAQTQDNNSSSLMGSFLSTLLHSLAIAQRKSKQIIRNRKLLAYTLLTPAFQIFLFFIAIGPNPRNLNFAIVNADIGIANVNLGNLVVNNLKASSDIFDIHMYNSLDLAVNRVKQGKEWGAMYIPTNFTSAMAQKTVSPTDPHVQYESTIHLYLDMSNYQITILIQQEVLAAFENMLNSTFNINLSPVTVDEAVYGDTNIQFKNFLAPGMIALVCFAHSIGITAVAFVREKNDGTMDRIYAAGVNSKAIIIGHYIISNAILIIQTAMLLLIVIFAFHVKIEGNVAWVILVLLALGGVGMSLGLVISGAATIETEAVQLSLSAYFPALLMSGVLWPVEAIPKWLGWLSYALPTTWASSALRSIMIRGWGLTHPAVYQAVLIIVAWSIALMIMAVIILKGHNIKHWFKMRKTKGNSVA